MQAGKYNKAVILTDVYPLGTAAVPTQISNSPSPLEPADKEPSHRNKRHSNPPALALTDDRIRDSRKTTGRHP
jgi:hypothetical protein